MVFSSFPSPPHEKITPEAGDVRHRDAPSSDVRSFSKKAVENNIDVRIPPGGGIGEHLDIASFLVSLDPSARPIC